jgi:uncharacterized protein (TIGR02594 family)
VAEPEWLSEARRYIGTAEVSGYLHSSTVVGFFHAIGHTQIVDDETAWCAAFVGAVLEHAGIRSTRALNARSYLGWGESITLPRLGCIVVFKRGGSSWQGHVGFYISHDENYIRVLGGNQSNRVGINTYPRRDWLGYRWPSAAAEKPRKTPSPTNVAIGVGGAAAGAGAVKALHDGFGLVVFGMAAVIAVAAAVVIVRRKRKKGHE